MDMADEYPLPYVDAQTLLSFLGDYRNPRDSIFRMVKSGKLSGYPAISYQALRC